MSRHIDSTHAAIKESLAKHRELGNAPPEEHQWLVEHGQLLRYELGEVVTPKGQLASAMLIVFAGHLVIRVDRGAGAHKIIEWKPGDVGGSMPYSRGAVPPNDVVVEETTRLLSIDKEILPALTQACPNITSTLVHLMLDRVRQFKASDLHDEKMMSLGKLSAGLAHEINNPAAAVVRSASVLGDSIAEAARSTKQLCSLRLSERQLDAITSLRDLCMTRSAPSSLSSIDRADREDDLAQWLAEHGADEEHALALTETSLTIADLDATAEQVAGEALDISLRWLAADCMMRSLAADIEGAGIRIRDLVETIKSYSYVDRALTPEWVDVGKGITETLALLEAKRREKAIKLWVDLPDALPRVMAVGGELNQVWMNLIDNAFDAVSPGGNVVVSAFQEGSHVIVKIVDDGPGVPDKDQARIFEPFFTTKVVGKGIGLGLDLVKRLLQRHEGSVDLESKPGMTEFLVRLPLRARERD